MGSQIYISELIFFFTGISYLFIHAAIEDQPEFPRWQAVFNLVFAFFFILYLILLIVNRVNENVAVEARSLTKWLFLFANLIWFLENGIYILKK